MTEPTSSTALISRPIAIDATRIPATPAGVASLSAEIAAAVRAIAERFDPDRIVLFGSRAYGTPHPESDVDLMVVMDTPLNLMTQADDIRKSIGFGRTPRLHISVRTPDDIARRLAEGDFFIEDVIGDGITLYARDGMVDPPPIGRRKHVPSGDWQRLSGIAREWISKAEDDEGTARFLLTSPIPRANSACFHAQQSTEKYLKAFLEHHQISFPRTHDLAALAALAAPFIPALAPLEDDLDLLSTCAVDSRYPGLDIDDLTLTAALYTMTTVRDLIQTALGTADETP